jgi:hypothetical protein
MPTPVLPDPVVAARTALVAQTTLTALVAQRIYYAIPATPTYPLLVLTLVDEDELRPETATARVQVDVWGLGGSTQQVLDCKAIAAVVRSVARDLRGTWGGATISNSVAAQVISSADVPTGRARFVVDLLLELNQ